MATQALYRKWRPHTFAEVIGQEHVTRTLRNALAGGRVSHAYLFTGPRGTGKTSMARLLAKGVNCLGEGGEKPCGTCRICQAVDEGRLIDLIEIDAASNRGIDEMRDLREKVGFRPNEARYKLYIIDEVHMLTEPAFNALLKTLEEPPAHVIFVLATTEPHKIPATIISRCQRFDFRRIPLAEIARWLTHIATQEGQSVEAPALEYIARQGGGSLRDSISLLDQLSAYGGEAVTLAQVHSVLGTAASQSLVGLMDCLIRGDLARGLELINQSVWDGAEPRQFTRDVVEHLRKMLLLKVGDGARLLRASATEEELVTMQSHAGQVSPRWLLRAIRLFNNAALETKTSFIPQLSLELAFLEAVAEESPPAGVPDLREGAAAAQKQPAPPLGEQPRPLTQSPEPPAVVPYLRKGDDLSVPLVVPGQTGNITLDVLRDNWRTVILANLRKVDVMAQGLMNSVTLLGAEGDEVIVEAPSDLLKGRIEQAHIRSKVEACISEVAGMPVRLRCTLKGEYRPRTTPATTATAAATAAPTAAQPPGPIPSAAPPLEAPPAVVPYLRKGDGDPMSDEIRKLGGVRNHQT